MPCITDFFSNKAVLESHITGVSKGEFRIEPYKFNYYSGDLVEREMYYINDIAVAYWDERDKLGAVFSSLSDK